MPAKPTLLIISQVYVPDPASVGQHIADAASAMVERGWRVRVYTSARGYDDPSKVYPSRETRDGVEIVRLPLSSFGKGSIKLRLLGQTLFLLQAFVRGLLTGNLKSILVSTSPPFAPPRGADDRHAPGGVPVKYWAMDLNPDQMIALGVISENSLPARVFDWINRRTLKRSSDVVALDRFMAERLNRKHDASDRMAIMPPWPHVEALEFITHDENPWRKEQDLDGKFVVMYSGNHGPSNPIGTVIEAAKALKDRGDIVFMFIGGGLQKQDVDAAIAEGYTNIRSLPFQPMETLKYSLSAADVHVVTVGNEIVGICHPCKVYGAMAVARPVFLLGPDPCHVSELIDQHDFGWHVKHGDDAGAARAVEAMASASAEERREKGLRAQACIRDELSRTILCGKFCDILERAT